MGFIEETGAAQHLRDARITLIYEGTNGIQANDLVGRKLVRDGGAAVTELVADMRATATELDAAPGAAAAALRAPLAAGLDALEAASARLLAQFPTDPAGALAGAVPYLRLMGIVAGGWLMAKSALAANRLLGLRQRPWIPRGEARHRTLLCRAHPRAGASASSRDCRRRDRDGLRPRPAVSGPDQAGLSLTQRRSFQ